MAASPTAQLLESKEVRPPKTPTLGGPPQQLVDKGRGGCNRRSRAKRKHCKLPRSSKKGSGVLLERSVLVSIVKTGPLTGASARGEKSDCRAERTPAAWFCKKVVTSQRRGKRRPAAATQNRKKRGVADSNENANLGFRKATPGTPGERDEPADRGDRKVKLSDQKAPPVGSPPPPRKVAVEGQRQENKEKTNVQLDAGDKKTGRYSGVVRYELGVRRAGRKGPRVSSQHADSP